jgi:hypothetical protein
MRRFVLRGKWRALVSSALVLMLAIGVPLAVFADDITSDVPVSGTAKVMTLTQGGPNGTTTLAVVPTGSGPTPSDGKSGCNLTSGKTLVVSVTSNNTSVATVNPTSITFASCGDAPTITVTQLSQGSSIVSLAQTSNNTDGTFEFSKVTFTVNVVPPPNTPPTVSVTGVSNGGSYEKGSVPAAGCLVSDTEDNITNSTSKATPSLSSISGPLAAYGIGAQTATCSFKDTGGLETTVQATYSIVDTTKPTISAAATTNPNANGWYNSDVAVHFTCTDSGSGIADGACPPDQTLSTEGSAVSSTAQTVTDRAGNTSDPSNVITVKIDKTGPTVSPNAAANSCTTPGDNGWCRGTQTAGFTAADATSGVASPCTATAGATGCNFTQTSSTNGSAVNIPSGAVSDGAGNANSGISAGPFKIDSVAPTLTVPTNISVQATSASGAVVTFNGLSASDALSTPTTVCKRTDTNAIVASGATFPLGKTTVTCTATDEAGNTTTRTFDVTVSVTLAGFYQPVDAMPTLNTVKGGSTVPFKFEVFGASNVELTDAAVLNQPTYKEITCSGTTVTDEIETLATGGTVLRYDTTAGQFVYNWQTPKTPGKCYQVTVSPKSGAPLTAVFQMK